MLNFFSKSGWKANFAVLGAFRLKMVETGRAQGKHLNDIKFDGVISQNIEKIQLQA
jgi:hypothetical protein